MLVNPGRKEEVGLWEGEREKGKAVRDLNRSTKGGGSRIWKALTGCFWHMAPAEIMVAHGPEPRKELLLIFHYHELHPM